MPLNIKINVAFKLCGYVSVVLASSEPLEGNRSYFVYASNLLAYAKFAIC